MKNLTVDKIELINAHGPYNHSSWSKGDICITNEERMSGRGENLVKLIRKVLIEHFSEEKMSTMSIVDVGSYDSWILHQLSDLPFKRLVGVEPRQKNIDKGIFVRKAVGISSRVEIIQGDLQILDKECFDIVLCIGVIHHLESLTQAINTLKNGTKQFLFIETICLSSKYITKRFQSEMEMKDLVYNYQKRVCGMSGQKLESSYYDGSATKLSVVSIPSIETLNMTLDIYFKEINIELGSHNYSQFFKGNDRDCNAICISAKPKNNSDISNQNEWIEQYEINMTRITLDRRHIEPFYKHINPIIEKNKKIGIPVLFRLLLSKNKLVSKISFLLLKKTYKNKIQQEILRNIKYNINDKISFEYGKILFHENRLESSIKVLKRITQKVNADWRSVYRSFFLLSLAYEKLGMKQDSIKYKDLLKISNPCLVSLTQLPHNCLATQQSE